MKVLGGDCQQNVAAAAGTSEGHPTPEAHAGGAEMMLGRMETRVVGSAGNLGEDPSES